MCGGRGGVDATHRLSGVPARAWMGRQAGANPARILPRPRPIDPPRHGADRELRLRGRLDRRGVIPACISSSYSWEMDASMRSRSRAFAHSRPPLWPFSRSGLSTPESTTTPVVFSPPWRPYTPQRRGQTYKYKFPSLSIRIIFRYVERMRHRSWKRLRMANRNKLERIEDLYLYVYPRAPLK